MADIYIYIYIYIYLFIYLRKIVLVRYKAEIGSG